MAARTRRDDQDEAVAASGGMDAWTGMLILSLLATLTGIVFLFLDYKEYPDKVPNVKALAAPPAAPPPSAGGPGTAAPGTGGAAAPK